jgi:hypothetical protein
MGNAFHRQGSQDTGLAGSGPTVNRETVSFLVFTYHAPPPTDFTEEKLAAGAKRAISLFLFINFRFVLSNKPYNSLP